MSNKKGVTLVALILTITILLILTGIRVVVEINDEGLISKAEKARMKTEQQEIEEKYERLKEFNNSNLIDVEKTIKKLMENFENIEIQEPEGEEDTTYTIVIAGNYGTYSYELGEAGFVELNELPVGDAFAILTTDGTLYFTRSDDYEIKSGNLYSKATGVEITKYNPKGIELTKDIEKVYEVDENKEYKFYYYSTTNEIVTDIPWISDGISSKVKSIKFEKIIKPISTYGWFGLMRNCTNIDVTNLDTQNVKNMYYMFYECNNLGKIKGIENFDTSNVTVMTGMFWKCGSLKRLDVSNFDVSKVENMNAMFYNCSSLTSLDVSGFDTSNSKNMGQMFRDCRNLKTLDVSGFNTSNVTNMMMMFYACKNLTKIDVSGFDTSKVTTMDSMFQGCNLVKKLDVSGFNTAKVTQMQYMFGACNSITNLNVRGFDTSKVTNMKSMFYGCGLLTSLDVSSFDTSKVTNMDSMFNSCNLLTSLRWDVSKFDTSKVTNMRRMFSECKLLTSLDLSRFNTANVIEMKEMFRNCSSLEELDLSKFDTSNVGAGTYSDTSPAANTTFYGSMSEMFFNCSSLTSVGDLSNWNTSNVRDMYRMFYGCKSLTSLDLSNFDTKNVGNLVYYYTKNGILNEFYGSMETMFYNCEALISVGDLSNWKTPMVTNMSRMFCGCKVLSADCSGWDVTNVTSYDRFKDNASGVILPLAWQSS